MVKPFLSENAMEVKIVNIMMQSAYLCVILYFKHKKKISYGFYSTVVGDVTGIQ